MSRRPNRGGPDEFPPICLHCHAIGPKTLSEHRPSCWLIRRREKDAKQAREAALRVRRELGRPDSGVQINKQGRCEMCGERATSLLMHLSKCKVVLARREKKEGDSPPPKPPTITREKEVDLLTVISGWIARKEVSDEVAFDAIDLATRFPLLSHDWVRKIAARAAEEGLKAGTADYIQIVNLFPKLRVKVLSALRGGLTRRQWLEVERKRPKLPVLTARQQNESQQLAERHKLEPDVCDMVVRGLISLDEALSELINANRSSFDYNCPDCGSKQAYHSCSNLDYE